MGKNLKNINDKLTEIIFEGIFEKKGKDVVNINLEEVENAVCHNFIICHGDSDKQVLAIAESIEQKTKEAMDEKPFKKQGYSSANWVVLDYWNTVVHIFREDYRSYYNLEELWADGKIEKISDK